MSPLSRALRRPWVLGVVAMTAAGGLGLSTLRSRSTGTNGEHAAENAASRLAFTFEPVRGEAREHRLRLQTQGEVREGVLGLATGSLGAELPFRIEVNATVRTVSLGQDAGADVARTRLAVRLTDVHVGAEGPQPVAGSAQAMRLEGVEMVLVVDRDGRVHHVEAPSHVGEAERNVLRTLAASLEVVAGPEGAKVWTAERPGEGGTVVVRYELEASEAASLAVRRSERQDAKPAGLPFESGAERTRSGQCTQVVERATGLPRTVHCTSTLVQTVGNARVLRQEDTVDLQGGRPVVVAEADLATLGRGTPEEPWTPLLASITEEREAARLAEMEALAGRLPLEGLLEGFLAGASSDEATRALNAHLRLHPERAALVGRALGRLSASDTGFHALAGGLARAGTLQAEKELMAACNRPGLDERSRVLLTVHASFAEKPSPWLEAALREIARTSKETSVVATADLALGTLGLTLRRTAPARAATIAEELRGRLSAARDRLEITHWLDALGNTGEASVPGAVAPHLSAEDTDVRRAAAAALRHVEGPAAASLLAKVVKEDGEAVVRAAAIAALAERGDGARASLELLRTTLYAERDEVVVRAGLEKLAALAAAEPAAIEELARYEQFCGLASLCRTAKSLLLAVRGPS